MDVVIYGTGTFAEYTAYHLSKESKYEVVGFCIERDFSKTDHNINMLPIFEFESLDLSHPPSKCLLFIAMGLNHARSRIYNIAKMRGYNMVSYISPDAIVPTNLQLGENSWVGEGTVIHPFVKIGNNSIVLGGIVGHHCCIENHTLLSVSTVGGNSTIQDYSFLGMNSTVKQNTVVAKRNIIGMGCVIERDTSDDEIYHSAKSTVKRSLPANRFNNKSL